jgi:formylglycine-generating enzyme required for sulfatase activity
MALALMVSGCPTEPEPGPAKKKDPTEITAFKIIDPVKAIGVIDEAASRITVTVSPEVTGDQLAVMKAEVTSELSGAVITPDLAEPQDYSSMGLTFTLTRADGTAREYTVVIKKALVSGFALIDPIFVKGIIDYSTLTIIAPISDTAESYELEALTAEFSPPGLSINPDPAAPFNYVTVRERKFTVTGEGGQKEIYTLKLEPAVPVELRITKEPDKRSYDTAGADIDLTGIELKLLNNAGLTKTVAAADYTISPAKIPEDITGMGHDVEITVTHTASGLTAAFTVKANIIPPPDRKPYTVGAITFNMNKVNAGSFLRQRTAIPDAADVTTITKAYRMGEFEVTNELFKEVLGKVQDGSGAWVADSTYTKSNSGADKAPAGQVSFYMAITFCNKLSLRLGLTPVYTVSSVSNWGTVTYGGIPKVVGGTSPVPSGNAEWDAVTRDANADGFRLPTEMEFIWAVIGADALNPGQQNNPGNLSDWWAGKELGLTVKECAHYVNNGSRGVVGRKAPNVLGLYDLNGNAQEIVWDRSKAGGNRNPWPSGQLTDWENDTVDSTRHRMTKGGSSSSAETNIKNLYFNDAIMPFQSQYDANGFRLAINEPAQ